MALDHAAIDDSAFPDVNVRVALTYEGRVHHAVAADGFAHRDRTRP